MLERKQALRAAEEALRLKIEIAKAEARERVYASLEDDHSNLGDKDGIVPNVKQSEPKFMASTPASHLDPAAAEFHSNGLVSKISPQGNDRISDVPQGMNAPSNFPYQLEPHEKSFKEVMAMQRQQNEQMIATHQQLAAAMTLCIQFHTANSLVQEVSKNIKTFCVCSLQSRPTPGFATTRGK